MRLHALLSGPVPQLFIGTGPDAFALSLAGLALPAGIAVVAALVARRRPAHAFWILAASLVLNGAAIVHQDAAGFPGGGVHLWPIMLLVLMLDYCVARIWNRPALYLMHWRDSAAIIAWGFVAQVIPDALSSIALASVYAPHASLCQALGCVGGAGWHDGLLIDTALTAAVWCVFALMLRITSARGTASVAHGFTPSAA